MKVFWWIEGQLYVAEQRDGYWSWGLHYRHVSELLREGAHEVSRETAAQMGWPA